jgi:hypothetical protein
VLVLDSLAASAAAPWLSHIGRLVGMLHQPPGGMDAHRLVRSFRAPFDRRAYRTCRLMVASSGWPISWLRRACPGQAAWFRLAGPRR